VAGLIIPELKAKAHFEKPFTQHTLRNIEASLLSIFIPGRRPTPLNFSVTNIWKILRIAADIQRVLNLSGG
jgi:hypothetical protein